MNMGHPRLLVGEPILFIHALQHTVIYGVVIVSRNLERTNEMTGFKMTALEWVHMCAMDISPVVRMADVTSN